MSRFLLSATFAVCAALSSATVTFSLDQEYWNVQQGQSVTVTGHISATAPDYITFGGVEHPTNGTDTLTAITFPSSLLAYAASGMPGDYDGDIFAISVPLSASLGTYDMSAAPGGLSSRSEVYVQEHFGAKTYVPYGIVVSAVPEPATLSALALGALGLIRRKTKKGCPISREL
jgi:hypothetical protein